MGKKSLSPATVFERIRSYCKAKEGSVEEYPWGDVVWKVRGKMFAASAENSSHVTVKASLADQTVLIQHPAIKVADYVGRFGWVTIHIQDEETLRMTEQLIDDSYTAVAPKRKSKPAPTPAARRPRSAERSSNE